MHYFYRITVYLRSQKEPVVAIRHNMFNDIEHAWTLYYANSIEAFPGNVEDFDCVQLSRQSREVRQYIQENKLTEITHVPHKPHTKVPDPQPMDYGDIPDTPSAPPDPNVNPYRKGSTGWRNWNKEREKPISKEPYPWKRKG